MHKKLNHLSEKSPENNPENFKQYLDIAGVMLLVLDTAEKVVLINKKGCEILGYKESEIIGKNWFDNFLPKAISSEVKRVYNQMMKGGEPGEYYENPIVRKNGEERIIYWHSSMLYNEKGKITGVLSSGEDITEFRKIQMELKRHSETMETLYILSQEIGRSTDMKDLLTRIGNVLVTNTSILGGCFYLPKEYENFFAVFSTFGDQNYYSSLPQRLGYEDDYLKNVINKKDGFTDKIQIFKNAATHPAHRLSHAMYSGNNLIGILSVLLKDTDVYTLDYFKLAASETGRGITRKITEEAQKHSEEKFYTVFQTSPEAISITKIDDGTFLAVNERFVELTGYKVEEVVGKTSSSIALWNDISDRDKLIKELKEKGKVSNFDTLMRKKNGFFNALLSSKIIEYNGRKCMLTVAKDITDRIKTEKEILATKDMLEKITNTSPAFISVHDLNEDKTIFSNKSILHSVGYTQEEVKKIAVTATKNRLFLYHPDDISRILESDEKMFGLKDGEVISLEFRLRDKNENYHWFRQSSAVYQRDTNGRPTQTVNVFENITDKKNAEELIEKRNKEINLLYEAGKNLAGTLDLIELYDRMYETVSQVADCDELFVSTYDDETNLIKYFYLRSKQAQNRIDVSKIPPIPLAPSGYGILSEAIRTGNSKIINDYQESLKKVKTSYTINEKGELAEDRDYIPNSAMIVPIKLDSRVFGVVQILSGIRNAFSQDQLNFVESLIHQVALANNNAILYKKAQDEIKERKIVEESLRRSEERLIQFSESVPDVLYRIDLISGKYGFLSPSVEKMLGYPIIDVINNPLEFTTSVLHPDDKDDTIKKISDFIKNGTSERPLEIEARMIRKDGNVIWIRDVIRFSWKDGRPIAASGVMSDISERKLEEENRRRRNEQIIKHQSALLEMSKLTNEDSNTTLKNITRITSETLNADRVSIWLFDDIKSQIECADMYFPMEGSHKFGMILDSENYKRYFNFIINEEKKSHTINNIYPGTESFVNEYLKPFGTTSFLIGRIRHHGEVAGFICIESTKTDGKEWTSEQMDFVISVSSFFEVAIESDERQKAEKEILKSLKDKELLLREIHHRVKNNLAVISSLLYLQSQKTQNKQVLNALTESQMRVKSMVLVHEKLYRSKDLSSINYAEYIESLAGTLFHSYEYESKRISLELDVKDIYLDTDSATNLGLIINELISNSIKHAFPDDKEGKIYISLNVNDKGLYTLMVKDDGKGMPPDFNIHSTDTLGLKLVSTLVEQIEGTLELDNTNGTCFKIQFSKHSQ